MAWMKSRRAKIKPVPKAVRQRAAPFQWRRDEGGQHAVSDSAEGQAHAVRRDPAEHMGEGQMHTGRHINRALAHGQGEAERADEDGYEAQRGKAEMVVEHDAERSAQSHGAVGADAVIADDLGGVFRTGAGDAPER